MPPEVIARPRAPRRLRLVPGPELRVVDVALFYGERSGGIRTYVDAKRAVLRDDPRVDHHVIVPGEHERHDDGWHELPSLRLAGPNGYRLPVGVAALKATLTRLRPDVVLLHDPFWSATGVAELVHEIGGRVVAVHHGSSALDAAGLPGPDGLWRPALRRWLRRAYRASDAVMAADDPGADRGAVPLLPLRFGVDPAFRPRPEIARGDHVLYAGRLAREKGLDTLLDAAALSIDRWPLELVGAGPLRDRVAGRAREFGLDGRVSFGGHVDDRIELARRLAGASCVVVPGPLETFGLAALEAAASGARVVACRTAPSVRMIAPMVHTFAPGDAHGLARAIAAARSAPRDLTAAWSLAHRATWDAAIAAEIDDLSRLLRPGGIRLRAA